MISPVVARTHALTEIGDSTGSVSKTEDDGHVPIRPLVKAVWKRCQALLPAETRMLFWANEPSEPILDNLGSVEVRRVPAGCFAETTVKGELARARATALLRLAKFTSGENRRGAKLAAERPLEIRRKAPGLWQFSLRLTEMDDASAVPIPRTRKVRVVCHKPVTYAVFVCRGRPLERVMQQAELMIMDAIAPGPWFACGAPVIRVFAPNAILPFMGSFELAVPVGSAGRVQEAAKSSDKSCLQAAVSRQPALEDGSDIANVVPPDFSRPLQSDRNPAANGGVLVATDLSAGFEQVVRRGVLQAQIRGDELTILHVVDAALPAHLAAQMAAGAKETLRSVLGSIAEIDKQRTRVVVEHGDIVPTILNQATNRGCRLIVMGQQHMAAAGRFHCCTTEQVVSKCCLPVLVAVTEHDGPYETVLSAVDSSSLSRPAFVGSRGGYLLPPRSS